MNYMVEAQSVCSAKVLDNKETLENKIISLLNQDMYILRYCQEEMVRLVNLVTNEPSLGEEYLEDIKKLSEKMSSLRATIRYLFAEYQRRYFAPFQGLNF